MPRINELTVENIRCFHSMQRARLGRITLLVGENSVGKSTFMGCYNAFAQLSNLVDLTEENPFDFFPFSMGGYDTIARSGAPGFTISGRYDSHIYSEAQFSFARSEKGLPFEEHVAFDISGADKESSRISVSTGNGKDREHMYVSFHGPNFEFQMDWAEISFVPISTWLSRNVATGFFPIMLIERLLRNVEVLVSSPMKSLSSASLLTFFALKCHCQLHLLSRPGLGSKYATQKT